MDEIEKEINRQTSLESVRKAMIRASKEHKEFLEMANDKMYHLYRLRFEQVVNRMVHTDIMISKDKHKLIEFARTYFNRPNAFANDENRYNIADEEVETSIHIEEIGII